MVNRDGALSSPHAARALGRIGQVLLAKWRLERLIGIGGMASVYAAVHRNGLKGALKMLHSELSPCPTMRARFLREGYAANAVDHDGAVRVLDDDVSDDGEVYLVMELLNGATLDGLTRLRGGRLAVEQVAAIGDQLLSVLTAAHQKGILHRDIKPHNLFLTRAGKLKVLDFGLARLAQRTCQGANATNTGSILGTPAYMAPEQALGRWREVDARSDLFGVAATLASLLCGERIRKGDSAIEVLIDAGTQPVPPLREIAPGAPASLCAVLDKALSFTSANRFPDALSMRRALRAAVDRCAPSQLAMVFDPKGGASWTR